VFEKADEEHSVKMESDRRKRRDSKKGGANEKSQERLPVDVVSVVWQYARGRRFQFWRRNKTL